MAHLQQNKYIKDMHKMEPTTQWYILMSFNCLDESKNYNDAWKKQVTEKYIPGDFTYGTFKKHAKLDNILCKVMCVYVN